MTRSELRKLCLRGSEPVSIVSAAAAHRHFRSQIGLRILFNSARSPPNQEGYGNEVDGHDSIATRMSRAMSASYIGQYRS